MTQIQSSSGGAPRRLSDGLEEIAPFEWARAPKPGMRSLYRAWCVFVHRDSGAARPKACEHFGRDPAELQALWERWQRGERWYVPD